MTRLNPAQQFDGFTLPYAPFYRVDTLQINGWQLFFGGRFNFYRQGQEKYKRVNDILANPFVPET